MILTVVFTVRVSGPVFQVEGLVLSVSCLGVWVKIEFEYTSPYRNRFRTFHGTTMKPHL